MGLKSHPKVLCEDLKSFKAHWCGLSVPPWRESFSPCEPLWRAVSHDSWLLKGEWSRESMRDHTFSRTAHIQWLNKAHTYIPAILLWQVNTHLQALCHVGLPILLHHSSFHKSWSLMNILYSKLHIPCGGHGEVVGGTVFHFLSLLSVFLTGEPNFPLLIHCLLPTDQIYRSMDCKGHSPLCCIWSCYAFPKLGTTSWPYI